MNINWEIVLSAIAVGISGYSFLSSRKNNQKLMNQQIQINELLLKKEQEYIEEKNQAKFFLLLVLQQQEKLNMQLNLLMI